MNCEACGHDVLLDHGLWNPDLTILRGLCEACYREPKGGPCFPWEFR